MKKLCIKLITVTLLGQALYGAGGDDPIRNMLLMDKLEILNNSEASKAWDGSFYLGYDLNKFYVYTTGVANKNGLERSQNELLYSRAIAPFWDIQAGITYDKNADASRTWAEVALSGLAPYYFDTRAALLLNTQGNIGLRISTEYEALLTQKLILTPSLEADFYSKKDSSMQLGSGLSNIEAGIRLRYEIKREFAPYIGVTWEKTFGATQDFNPVNETNVLVGVRFWF